LKFLRDEILGELPDDLYRFGNGNVKIEQTELEPAYFHEILPAWACAARADGYR
jgi:hypothetical protein